MSGRAGPIDPLLGDDVVTVDELYRVHRERLTRLAASVTFDRSLAEEIVQDAFAGLQQRIGTIADPVGYLQRSVINRGVSALRRRRVAQRYVPPLAVAGGDPEVETAWAAVVRLPVRQRTVVVLRFWHDMADTEIAEVLGWPVGTVKSTLHRALQRLREEVRTWSG